MNESLNLDCRSNPDSKECGELKRQAFECFAAVGCSEIVSEVAQCYKAGFLDMEIELPSSSSSQSSTSPSVPLTAPTSAQKFQEINPKAPSSSLPHQQSSSSSSTAAESSKSSPRIQDSALYQWTFGLDSKNELTRSRKRSHCAGAKSDLLRCFDKYFTSLSSGDGGGGGGRASADLLLLSDADLEQMRSRTFHGDDRAFQLFLEMRRQDREMMRQSWRSIILKSRQQLALRHLELEKRKQEAIKSHQISESLVRTQFEKENQEIKKEGEW